MIEEEDEEAKKERQKLETEETMERHRHLEDDVQSWERRKSRGLESKAAKRRYSQGDQDEDSGRRKNGKKLRFSLLREDWGEMIVDSQQGEEPVVNTPPSSSNCDQEEGYL